MPTWEVIQGDCLEVLPTLAGRVDAVVTDPPYGVNLGSTKGAGTRTNGSYGGLKRDAYATYDDTYENFVGIIVPRLNACLDMVHRASVFTGQHIHEQRKPDAIGGVYHPSACGRHCWGFKDFLPVLLYGKCPHLSSGAGSLPTVLRSTANSEKNGHPCPKPIEWMVWLIERTTLAGETVLDPFCGSGTTGVACMQTGRNFIGIELDAGYCEIARRRIAEAANHLFQEAP